MFLLCIVGWLVLFVRWGTKKWAYGGDKSGNLKYRETPKVQSGQWTHGFGAQHRGLGYRCGAIGTLKAGEEECFQKRDVIHGKVA